MLEKRNLQRLRRRRRKLGTEWRFSQSLRAATEAMDRVERGVNSSLLRKINGFRS